MRRKQVVSLFWAVLAGGIPLVLNAVWDREVEFRQASADLEILRNRVGKVEEQIQRWVIRGKIEAERRRLLKQSGRELMD